MSQPEPIFRSESPLAGKKVTVVVDDDKLPKREAEIRKVLVLLKASEASETISYSVFMHQSKALCSDVFILSNSALFSRYERPGWICEALIDSRVANPDAVYVIYTDYAEIFADLSILFSKGTINAVVSAGEWNDMALLKHASAVYGRVLLQ